MTEEAKPSIPEPGRSLFSRLRKKTPTRSYWGVPSADAINLGSRVNALEEVNNTLKNRVFELENQNNTLKNERNTLENSMLFLQQENLMLKVKVDETKDKMKKVFDIKNLRARVIQDVLDIKYQDERKRYIDQMRDKYGRGLDIGTYTEGNLVRGDVNIPQARPISAKPVVADPGDIELNFVGGSVTKKKKPKKTKKAKKTKKPRRSNGVKKTNGKGKLKKRCRDECNKSRKLLPLVFKKMGLSKGEITKKMKEHDEQCTGNCLKLIQDKSLIEKIMKNQ